MTKFDRSGNKAHMARSVLVASAMLSLSHGIAAATREKKPSRDTFQRRRDEEARQARRYPGKSRRG